MKAETKILLDGGSTITIVMDDMCSIALDCKACGESFRLPDDSTGDAILAEVDRYNEHTRSHQLQEKPNADEVPR